MSHNLNNQSGGPRPNFQHEYNGESFPFVYDSESVTLYLQADSNNKIFKVKFESKESELKEGFNSLCQYSLDKDLDEMLKGIASDFQDHKESIDYQVLHFQQAFKSYIGEQSVIELIDGDNLICRCAKVDKNAIENYFLKENGDKKEILKKTNASMICGTCTLQIQKSFHDLGHKHQLFEGKSYQIWRESLNKSIEQFAFYSPQEFEGAQITVSKIAFPKLELNIKVPHSNLTADFAQRSLTNYLSKELEARLGIGVTVDNFLSN